LLNTTVQNMELLEPHPEPDEEPDVTPAPPYSHVDGLSPPTPPPAVLLPLATQSDETENTNAADQTGSDAEGDEQSTSTSDGSTDESRAQAALDCRVGSWMDWSHCGDSENELIKMNVQTRTRKMIQPQQPGGRPCPHLHITRGCRAQEWP
jgi:hypothetical protein